jgi:hypothetical protein
MENEIRRYRPLSLGSSKKLKPIELKSRSPIVRDNRSLIKGFSERTQTRFYIKKKEI